MNWRDKFYRFMQGRYGRVDELGKFLMYLLFGLLILSFFVRSSLISLLILVVLGYDYYRILSKDFQARYQENQKYLKFAGEFKRKWARFKNNAGDRDHRIFSCPNCGQKVRVPRGKGQISIHCPKCHTNFEKRT